MEASPEDQAICDLYLTPSCWKCRLMPTNVRNGDSVLDTWWGKRGRGGQCYNKNFIDVHKLVPGKLHGPPFQFGTHCCPLSLIARGAAHLCGNLRSWPSNSLHDQQSPSWRGVGGWGGGRGIVLWQRPVGPMLRTTLPTLGDLSRVGRLRHSCQHSQQFLLFFVPWWINKLPLRTHTVNT